MKKRFLAILTILIVSLLGSQIVLASNSSLVIPIISISSVTEGVSVTIKGTNFPSNDEFKVTMGVFGTQGIGGIVVATQDSGTGTFTATYTIPASLKTASQIAIRLQSPTSGYYSYNWFWNAASTTSGGTTPTTTWGYPPAGAATIPSTSITNVNAGVDVKVAGTNFTTTDTYTVYIGKFGTKGVGGVKIGTVDTDASGKFTETFAIPTSLKGEDKLAIRFVSLATGYYAYDWFYNQGSASTSTSTTGVVPPAGAGTIPTFTITKVSEGNQVTINAKNFIANDTYDVYMGVMGSKGVGGIKVATQASPSSGAFTATYDIPASLAGNSMIAIRLQSPTTGYYSYNWFYNSDYP
ncbi:hypothetical protein KQH54_03590 [bacterium]|nr:hypothetical protein [bacterium]